MIAMFDSGLGGLSIWQAVVAKLPHWPVTYLADQAYCPYGSRTQAQIVRRSLTIAHWLEKQGASLIIVACNTATSVAVDQLRHELSLPVIGIEPAVKPAAAQSHTKCIAVLATQALLNSARFHSLIAQHARNVEVLSYAGNGWVEQVEVGDLDSEKTRRIVYQAMTPLIQKTIDHIVLGCTHYVFLAPLIKERAGENVVLNDPTEAIVRRTAAVLSTCRPPVTTAQYRFITTSHDPEQMAACLSRLIGQDHPVETLLLH